VPSDEREITPATDQDKALANELGAAAALAASPRNDPFLTQEHISMAGEFAHIAQRIAETGTNGGIAVAEIAELVADGGMEVNCYPGQPSDRCHQVACFVAIHGALRKGKGHYNVAQALDALIRLILPPKSGDRMP
jgi:hypothetical protein